MARRYYVFLNARAGTALGTGITGAQLHQHFHDAGHDVIIDDDVDLPMSQRIEHARRSSADAIVAAGGDGTVTTSAAAAVASGKLLAILPLGTVNLLARDLGIPLKLEQWMAALDAMEPRQIDVGEVNGKLFLHKVVAGVVPGLAAGREHLRGQGALGVKIGYLRFFARRLFRARRMAIEVAGVDGGSKVRRVAAVAVANNEYDEGLGLFFSRQRIDRGVLTAYLLRHLSLGDVLRLGTRMLAGHWRDDEALEISHATSLTVRTRRQKIKVMLDGDVMMLDSPLRFDIRPGALNILAPPLAKPVDAAPAIDVVEA
jgi:diacylglycerol kinase family enzyme